MQNFLAFALIIVQKKEACNDHSSDKKTLKYQGKLMFFHSFCEEGRMLSFAVEPCLSKLHIFGENSGKGGRKTKEKRASEGSL